MSGGGPQFGVFFHGTAACNLGPILDGGFAIPTTPPSVSIATNSSLPFRAKSSDVFTEGLACHRGWDRVTSTRESLFFISSGHPFKPRRRRAAPPVLSCPICSAPAWEEYRGPENRESQVALHRRSGRRHVDWIAGRPLGRSWRMNGLGGTGACGVDITTSSFGKEMRPDPQCAAAVARAPGAGISRASPQNL
jgi:hypothetical protein